MQVEVNSPIIALEISEHVILKFQVGVLGNIPRCSG